MQRDTLIREFSAGGVVFKKEKNQIQYLLIQDNQGRWSLPKGHIESEENIREAAIREIKEETGLKKLKIVRELERLKYFYAQGKDLIFKTVYLYLIESSDKEEPVPQKTEVKNVAWLSPKEALKKISYKNTRDLLEKAIKGGRVGRFREI